MFRIIILASSAALAAGILFVNIYTSVIDAVNWGAAIPDSIAATREYFKVVNPGNFFRIASPANQVLALVALIACWKLGRVRYIALGALILMVLSDVFTFAYFYPRNDIMFVLPMENSTEKIRLAWEQWSSMNWVRSAMCLGSTVLAMSALIVTTKKTSK